MDWRCHRSLTIIAGSGTWLVMAIVATVPVGAASPTFGSGVLGTGTVVSGPPVLLPSAGTGATNRPAFIIPCDVGAGTSWAAGNNHELVFSSSMYCELAPLEMVAQACFELFVPGHAGQGGVWGSPEGCVADESYDANIVLAAGNAIVYGFQGKPTYYRAWGYLDIARPPVGYACGPCSSTVLGNEIYGPS